MKGLQIIGKTQDGKLVVSGIARLYYESGLPLCIIFDRLKAVNLQVSWLHLVDELKNNGMNLDRIFHLLNEHIFESYGKDYRDEIMIRLNSKLAS